MALNLIEDIENCFSAGWSDGLPVVPPYGSLVDQMLEALGWAPTDEVGAITEQDLSIRAEHLAAAAVMAGCRPEYSPVLRAVSLALVDPAFNLSGVEVTTGGAAALVVVSGPIVDELGFEHESNPLGANCRANATIGRFANLVRYFCGRGGGSLHSHGTMGHPGRLTFCVAEHPTTLWPTFHTQFHLDPSRSAVTLMATEGPNSVNSHYATNGSAVLECIADCMAHFGATNFYWHSSGVLIVLGPEHMELVAAEFSREEARQFVFQHAVRSTEDLRRVGRIPPDPLAHAKVADGSMRSPVPTAKRIHFLESGNSGGKFSAVIPRWVGNPDVIAKSIDHP